MLRPFSTVTERKASERLTPASWTGGLDDVHSPHARFRIIDDFTQLTALEAVIDRARSRLSPDDLPSLVMNDPGTPGYVQSYRRVLAGGVPALVSDYEGRRLLESFDITENLLLSHTDAARSSTHRWFSVLTAGIEILGWDGWEGPRCTTPATSLAGLVTDAYALNQAGDRQAPLDLLPPLCQELRMATHNRHQVAAMLLAELLVPMGLDEVEERCRELVGCHNDFQVWGDDQGEPNRWFVENPAFVWGAIAQDRRTLRRWLPLVETHFPDRPEIALVTRDRLLADARVFRSKARR
ncbi:hypothetical protein ACFL6C_04205 [Myxococcota bacterium]